MAEQIKIVHMPPGEEAPIEVEMQFVGSLFRCILEGWPGEVYFVNLHSKMINQQSYPSVYREVEGRRGHLLLNFESLVNLLHHVDAAAARDEGPRSGQVLVADTGQILSRPDILEVRIASTGKFGFTESIKFPSREVEGGERRQVRGEEGVDPFRPEDGPAVKES